MIRKEGSQNKLQVEKIPEGQEYAPRLEPAAPIRLADRNHAHYPSRHCTILKKRRLNDGLPYIINLEVEAKLYKADKNKNFDILRS